MSLKKATKGAAFERRVSWVFQIVPVQVSLFHICLSSLFFPGVPSLLLLEILRCSCFFGRCCGFFSSVLGFGGICESEALLNTFKILMVKTI